MRDCIRSRVAVALLAVVSVISLLGISLVGIRASPEEWVSIFAVKPIHATPFYESVPGRWIGIPGGPLVYIAGRSSSLYGSWGREEIHMVMKAEDLTAGQSIVVKVYGRVYNPADPTAWKNMEVWSNTLNEADPVDDFRIPIPSNKFYFYAFGAQNTRITLSFYLSL